MAKIKPGHSVKHFIAPTISIIPISLGRDVCLIGTIKVTILGKAYIKLLKDFKGFSWERFYRE
jgi:hypothetical protein